MKTKTEEIATPKRSTYIDVNTGEATVTASEEVKQTIAEARAAQVAELQAQLGEAEALATAKQQIIDNMAVELAELHEAMTELKKTPNGVEAEVYPYASDDGTEKYIVVQIDTTPETGRIKVYVNDGTVYDNDPEQETTQAASPMSSFAEHLQRFLAVQEGGPAVVLGQLSGRDPIERAGYVASIRRLAAEVRNRAEQLDDLYAKTKIAAQMFEED